MMSVIRSLLLLLLVFTLVISSSARLQQQAEVEDNDFAEFEDFEDEDGFQSPKKEEDMKVIMSPDAEVRDAPSEEEELVEEDEDDFEHFSDEEEFEGFDKDSPEAAAKNRKEGPGSGKPDLKIQALPPLANNWENYYLEILMLMGLFVYATNYLTGRMRNSRLAYAWFEAHKELLEANFVVVGDDGATKEIASGVLMKETESIYKLWCSGRTVVEGMLITLKLLKRQDLISTITRFFRPQNDQIIIKANVNDDELDSFVFCVGNKKTVAKMHKDLHDLNSFCPDKKSGEKFGLLPTYLMLNEIQEVAQQILDPKLVNLLNKYQSLIDFIHISDKFTGLKGHQEDAEGKQIPSVKVLICAFNLPSKVTASDLERLKPLLQLVFYLLEKIQKIRLGREGRMRADKNRQWTAQLMHKMTHSARMESSQKRKDKKKQDEKDRILEETDPEKQRRLEEKSLKKEKRKQQFRVKTIKMKAN